MEKLAVIVPYRNREQHLKSFIPHMEKSLADEKIPFDIFIVEQYDDKPFNRAKLLNVGFNECKEYDYFAFHDVDMLPIDSDYSFPDGPTHLSSEVEQFNWGLPYDGYFGGVTLFDKESFLKINGYSNEYWGWGAEDDDVLYRCHLAELKVQRQSPGILKSLSHDRQIDEQDYKKNIERIRDMWSKKLDWQNEGMNSCKYSVLDRNETPERIMIKVSI